MHYRKTGFSLTHSVKPSLLHSKKKKKKTHTHRRHRCIKDDSEELLKHALKKCCLSLWCLLNGIVSLQFTLAHPPLLCLLIFFYFLTNANTTNTRLHTLTALMSLSTQSCATLCTCVRCCRRCECGSLTWHKGHWTV